MKHWKTTSFLSPIFQAWHQINETPGRSWRTPEPPQSKRAKSDKAKCQTVFQNHSIQVSAAKSSTNSLACSWHIRRSCHADKAKLYWHHSKLRHTYNHSAVGSKQSKVHHWPSFPHIFQFAFHMHKEPERKLMSHEVSLLTNLNSLPPPR